MVGGTALSLLTFYAAQRFEQHQLTVAFREQAAQAAAVIQRRLDESVEVIESIGHFYAASPAVGRDTFRQFVRGALARHPDLQALSWAPRVPAAERTRYIEEARAGGFPAFQITELSPDQQLIPAAERDVLFPVYFLEPLEGNERALGFDLFSEPARRRTLMMAWETGALLTTPRLTLVQDAAGRSGILMVLPVYQRGALLRNREDRQAQLAGMVTLVFYAESLVEEALRGLSDRGIVFQLVDEAESEFESLLYTSMKEGEVSGPLSWSTAIHVPGRSWMLKARSTPRFTVPGAKRQSRFLFGVSLLLVLLLMLYVRQVGGLSAHLETLVAQRTAELSRANEQLHEQMAEAAKLASIIHSSHDAIIGSDLNGTILSWNRGAADLFGYTPEEIVGQPIARLVPEDRREETAWLLDRARNGESVSSYLTVRKRRTGPPLALSLTVSPVRDSEGRIIGASEIGRDVTAQRRNEVLLARNQRELQEKTVALQRTVEELTRQERVTQSLLRDLQASRDELQAANEALQKTNQELEVAQMQLIQAAKLESVGRLAAGVAHEVKNPLAIILMGIAFLQQQLGSSDEVVAKTVTDMDRAVKRADAVIRGLLDFAAFKQLTCTTEAVNGVVEQSLLFVKHELSKAGVTVVKELAADLPPVSIDRAKIEQVLVNLFGNALHAMAPNGTLTVRTFLKRLTELGSGVGRRASDRFKAGETAAVIQVDDTGKGIPPDLLAKVWDPFVTTKPAGQGTGLGLSISRNIIELHRGLIDLQNRPEGGVRATIMLHVAAGTQPSTEPPKPVS